MRRLRGTFGLVLLPILVAAPGCVRQWTRIETNVENVRVAQVAQKADMESELSSIRSELQHSAELDREKAAELNARLDAMERLVTQLSAQWEEQQRLLRDLRQALELAQRNSAIPPAQPADGGADPTSTEPVGDASAGMEIYDAAWADFTRGNFTLARQGFTELVDRFPDSSVAGDARYWIAETYYNQSSYQEALGRFESVLESGPSESTQAKCLLKMGYCRLALDDNEAAVEVLQRLLREFPDSDEALIAENRLSSLSP